VDTPLEAIILILSGAVLVNKEVIRTPNFIVDCGDVFELSESFKKKKYKNFLKRAEEFRCLPFQPFHLEVNFLTSSAIVIFPPVFKDLFYPFTTNF
jgi:ribosomal protein S4